MMTEPVTERRSLSLDRAGVQVRTEGDGPPRFVGYAARYNERAAIGNPLTWGFYEQVAPGAFTKSVREGDARFLVDHDTRAIVARVSAGDLTLDPEDAEGLLTVAELDQELSYVRDLTRNLEKRRITGMSFAFDVIKDSWDVVDVETRDGTPVQAELRTLLEVRLPEVSAVTFPAYQTTTAALRSVASALVHRGDADAVQRRAVYRPELLRYTEDDREPGRTTRGAVGEPGVSTPAMTVAELDLTLRGYAARFGLPFTQPVPSRPHRAAVQEDTP